jgi:hypothetical protein
VSTDVVKNTDSQWSSKVPRPPSDKEHLCTETQGIFHLLEPLNVAVHGYASGIYLDVKTRGGDLRRVPRTGHAENVPVIVAV